MGGAVVTIRMGAISSIRRSHPGEGSHLASKTCPEAREEATQCGVEGSLVQDLPEEQVERREREHRAGAQTCGLASPPHHGSLSS